MKVPKTPRGRVGREDDGNAFLPDPSESGRKRVSDDLAEELAEEFVMAATSGEYVGEDELDQEVPEESGGPFVIHPASYEFAQDVDDSNPADASREALPSPMRAR